MADLKTNNSLKGLVITASASRSNIRQGTSTDTPVLATISKGNVMGTATGRFANMKDGRWYEFILPDTEATKGFAREDVVKILTREDSQSLEEKGKGLINELIANDQEIFYSLTLSGALIDSLVKKGRNVYQYQEKHRKLYDRLEKRQDKIKKSRLLKAKTGFKSRFRKAIQAFKIYLQYYYHIGAVPLAAIVVSAAIGAGLAVTAYFVFRSDYSESKSDLKISKDLEKALKNLDPQTAGKVIEDLELQIDTAYAKGKTAGKFTGALGTVKNLLLLFLGFILVDRFIEMQNKPRTRRNVQI